MIKILYLYEHLRIGGAERLFLTSLKYLDRKEFYPVIYCLSEKGQIGQEIERNGFRVNALNRNINIFNPLIIYELVRIFKREKPDIVHTHLFFPNIYGRLASKLAGIKNIVTTLHNADYTFEDNGKWTFKIRKMLDKYSALVSGARFIAVSEFVKQDYEAQLGFRNIKVILNCADISSFEKARGESGRQKRKELGLKEDDIAILNVGRLHPQKGQIYLIEAFSLIHEYNPSSRLLIIGKGAIEQALKNRVSDLGLKDSVIFLKDRPDIPEIMSACDIFVFPSLYEGNSIALAEAMASGLAIVASDIDCFREILTHDFDAILVDKANHKALAEAICKLIDDQQKRINLGQNARKKAETLFDAPTHVRNLENFYKEVTGDVDSRGQSCLVCGGGSFENSIYGGYFYENKKYNIVKCSGCGFMFLNPLPDKATLDNIYGNDDYFNSYYLTASGKRPYLEAMDNYNGLDGETIGIIKRYKQSGKLLDVGCAGGRFLANAIKSGFEVLGVEPNQKMVDHARKVLGLDVIRGSLEEANLKPNYFDVIHAGDVLEHILNLEQEMLIIKKLLGEQGVLIISQPLMYNKSFSNFSLKINMLLKRNRYSDNPPTHLWEFNPSTLKIFLKKIGFRIIYFRISEVKARPLAINDKLTIKNRLGFHIKNFSSFISNNPLFAKFEIGDRAIVVCKKEAT